MADYKLGRRAPHGAAPRKPIPESQEIKTPQIPRQHQGRTLAPAPVGAFFGTGAARKKGGHLNPVSAWRIVKKAAAQAGIDGNVSPHWLRHAHASHALERGAPVALVRVGLVS